MPHVRVAEWTQLQDRLAAQDAKIEELQQQASVRAAKVYEDQRTERWKQEHYFDRLKAADSFIWMLMIWMATGGFEDISFATEEGRTTREAIAREMQPWLDHAYAPWEDEDDGN
jgi:hypothetical protein